MESTYYIGIMSGTSLDGVDAVLVNLGLQQRKLVKT
ncbi:MAG TPA: anhydro-N-acetylmuramic acid kinase, partial [Nitrosomonas sp.]|nr:anhydro-N-acetylmuramic acid kinase [Nitrosomonas sp.]